MLPKFPSSLYIFTAETARPIADRIKLSACHKQKHLEKGGKNTKGEGREESHLKPSRKEPSLREMFFPLVQTLVLREKL